MTTINGAKIRAALIALAWSCSALTPAAMAQQNGDCDKTCMEDIAQRYLEAYEANEPEGLAISETVRFTENNVEMPFPDGTWHTVTEELGPALVLSDPETGNVAIYTAILQREIEGFLAVRLGIRNGEIAEIEHIVSTARNLSRPPTPIGDAREYEHEPVINEVIPEQDRLPREQLITIADGYFKTLQRNNGYIHTCFTPEATRRENGLLFTDIEGGFESGRYLFNDRVRREHILVDEERAVVLARGFIDHKGVLDVYTLTDGTPQKSVFQEPQTWAFLEMFKIKDECIAAVVATFYQAPYHTQTPWDREADR